MNFQGCIRVVFPEFSSSLSCIVVVVVVKLLVCVCGTGFWVSLISLPIPLMPNSSSSSGCCSSSFFEGRSYHQVHVGEWSCKGLRKRFSRKLED